MSKKYIDKRGWIYFVRAGLGLDTFNTFYKKPGKSGAHSSHMTQFKTTAEEAQADLDALAVKKGWKEVI